MNLEISLRRDTVQELGEQVFRALKLESLGGPALKNLQASLRREAARGFGGLGF